MKISVIISVYNEEDVIKDCLGSLSKQTLNDFEIIVVDDGSTDRTLEIVSKIKNVSVKIFKQDHRGPGAARNFGVKKSVGQILVFVDADMTFDSKFLERLTAPIRKGLVKGTFSKEEFVVNWDSPLARCWNINQGWVEKRRHPKNYPNRQKVFRAILKSEFERVNGFTPGGYNDDWTLSEKLGYEAENAKGAIFYHKNPSSFSEVFKQAKWIGKREYKFGLPGSVFALLRVSFPVSLFIGFIKFVIKGEPTFVLFKIVYDFGVFVGIIEYFQGKKAK